MLLAWDRTIKVGDYITAYHKGVHRVTEIEPRIVSKALANHDYALVAGDEYTPIIHYEKILDASYKPAKRKLNCCDAAYCRKISVSKIQQEQQMVLDGLKSIGIE